MKKAAFLILSLLLSSTAFADPFSWSSGFQGSKPSAENVKTDTTNFDNNLSSADNTVQKALDTLDEMSGGGTPGGSDTQVQFNDGGSFGGDSRLTYDKTNDVLKAHKIAGDASDGLLVEANNGTDVAILGSGNTATGTWYGTNNFEASLQTKNGATGAGFVNFFEDSDNGSNYVKLIGPASTSDITLTLPNSDGDADQVLKTDGSGNMSWTTISSGAGDITTVGDCTTGDCFNGAASSGSALTFDHGTGTYGADGTITFDPSNNKFTIKASALTDAGGSQSTIAEFIPINTATHQIGQIVVKGINNFGGVTRLGGNGDGGYWAGSIPAQAGAGFIAWGADIYPASHTAGESTTVSVNNGGVNLGTSSYRWNNVYSEAGNFSGEVTISDTNTGSNPGTDLCIDSGGKICACGSCA